MTAELTQLNKNAIAFAKQYTGSVAWPTIAMVALVLLSLFFTLTAFSFGNLPIGITIILVGLFTYMAYTPLHEAAHANIHGDHTELAWLNHLCGFLVAPIIAVPYASHRLEHLTHHRYTNHPDKDPDFVVSAMANGFISTVVAALKFLWVQNTFFAFHGWRTASVKERAIYCSELCLSIGWRVAFVITVDQPYDIAVLLWGYLLGGIFTAYWFAYRPHAPYKTQQRYRNTSSLIMPNWLKPLEFFWFGQNLHSVHHLFPRVPFYHYHALHKDIAPILRAHDTPIIGIFSRREVTI